ncbi:MAG: OmpA family protein [Flavobacteriales bacterium]|nr:OmpA family protein [Flavobacteriales bacterium]
MKFLILFISVISIQFVIKAQETKIFHVYFPFDVSEITESEKARIYEEVLPFVDSTQVISIQIIGNTDAISSNEYNYELGLKRASSVKEMLADFLPVISKISSLGKSTPKFPNETSQGRQSNRRVDIVIEYNLKMEELIDEFTGTESQPFENDTTITFKEGVEFHIKAESFYPNKIKDVQFEVTEVLSPFAIIQNNLSTMTADGRCLKSGGMILTQAQIDGNPVLPNDSITVRIPASEIDTSMTIWDIKVVDGDTLWIESDIQMTYNEKDKYYEFKTSNMPSINVDAPVIGPAIDKIQGLFKDKNTTIKARGKSYVECYLISYDELIVLRGDLIKPKKSYFAPCLTDPNDIVIAHVKKKDKDFYMVKPLGEIKLKRGFNHFVIRKRDLKSIHSYREYENTVQERCDELLK